MPKYTGQTDLQSAFEKALDTFVSKFAYAGLKMFYIGNFERWGDDRLLMIEDKEGNTFWRCAATQIDAETFKRGIDGVVKRVT